MLVVLEYKYRILCEELLFPYDSYVFLLLPLIAQGFIQSRIIKVTENKENHSGPSLSSPGKLICYAVQWIVIYFFNGMWHSSDVGALLKYLWIYFDHGMLSKRKKVPVSQSPHSLSGEGCFNYRATLEEMLVALIVLVSITSSQMRILFFLIDSITLQVEDWVCFSW